MTTTNKNNDGRPQALTCNDLITAITTYKTANGNELAKKLKIGKSSIYRRLQQLTPEKINQALTASGTTILGNMTLEQFKELSEIKQYYETLRFIRKTTDRYARKRINNLYHICRAIGKRANYLTPNDAKELLVQLRKGKFKMGEYDFRMGCRIWFGYKGISGNLLKDYGLSADCRGEDRSNKQFTKDQRHAILQQIILQSETMPVNERVAMRGLVKFLFYTGTRIGKDETGQDYKTGALNVLWENVAWEQEKVTIHLLDKGKKGGIWWDKYLMGEAFHEFRKLWIKLGRPKEGRIFPFRYEQVRKFFRDCYEAAMIDNKLYSGMTCHIWRHTAGSALLRATDYNYGTSSKLLGWESVEVLRKHYGKMPQDAKERELRMAMGLPVKTILEEFKF